MLISQVLDAAGNRCVVVRNGSEACILKGIGSTYELVLEAIGKKQSLTECIRTHELGAAVDLEKLAEEGRILLPIDHPDAAHMHLTGTGLTHLGSAATRDAMHAKDDDEETQLTDSMKMFRMGLENGKPPAGKAGVQPEWFYKGNGSVATAPGEDLVSPGFCDDGGEEPEIAGIYVIASDGTPFRVGFALANEFSDHVMERQNYLYLAHSKLRPASFGPELLVGDLPKSVEGTSRIYRNGSVIWEKPFLSGEANMSHTLANLEHHHFKYDLFRQPGDVHVHMFGTATLSFADGVSCKEGDEVEISAPGFGVPLKNKLSFTPSTQSATIVKVL
ncbi:MAG: GguC protein [Roseibium sp.]|uniref:AraD1 family protein n=1 Tax=Roseibium sp. TaxID=1936156 RepID=UPI001B167C4F|nr:AraD1 family protein [Roseibium sp.]MBO6895328.1 GguC protein [Roseibium sp.]MBO6933200.1 GguC protein [Roseibium sp.]